MSLLSFFCMKYSSVIPLDVFSFMDICLCFVIWFVLLTWGISSFTHCGLEAWSIMEDVEPISLGSEIWLREFETVTHLLMIRVVPCSLPTPCLCFDLHPSIVSFAQHHHWGHYMTFPSSAFLPFHIPFLIRLGIVWGVWAQGWFHMARIGLWSLDGLRCEDWSIAWWDCHLFHCEYRDWSCMMRVGSWWVVVLDGITVYFALRGSSLRLLWSIWSTVDTWS